MRILLLQNAIYLKSFGGSNKSNRLLLESLASMGHQCRVIARATNPREHIDLRCVLDQSSVPFDTTESMLAFAFNGVGVCAALSASRIAIVAIHVIEEFEPDYILVSSEDFGHHLLKTALSLRPDRVVLLVHTTHDLPFGPSSFWPNKNGHVLISKVRAIVAVSKFVRKYIEAYGELDASVVPFPVFGAGPFPTYSSFDSGYVLMINPCAIKGISLFLEIARAFPHTPFAAVPTWGTTDADRTSLRKLPNMNIMEPCEDVDDVYSRTRVLLVPSLFEEALGLVAIEAMLRGIPVISSDVGGLPEAKLGVDYCISVRPIQSYLNCLDGRMLPCPIIPSQDVTPWIEALATFLDDREVYERVSDRSKTLSRAYVAKTGVENFNRFLESLL